jgi:hypothetical protein
MSNTDDRNLACRTASGDPKRALDFARRIPDPWFRAQALACVARYAPEDLVEQLAAESLRGAQEAGEMYRIVAVSAWPIRALIERGCTVPARRALSATLDLVPQVQPLASRAEALSLLWQAAFPAGQEFRAATWQAITRHCDPNAHWRAARLYGSVVYTLASENVAEARAIVEQMPAGTAKRKAARLLERGTAYPPREFFHVAA